MSTKIILFKTYPVNVTNLVIAQLIENAVDSFYSPCRYILTDNKFFTANPGEFANNFSNIRNANWLDSLSYINSCLAYEKTLIFGNHNNSQISYLKSIYKSDILTIGINYNEDLYPALLTNFAEYHVHLLNTGSIVPNDADKMVLTTLTEKQLVSHYIQLFDSNGSIPRSSNFDCDYNITLNDFVDKSKMEYHFCNLGFPFTEESLNYYNHWAKFNSLSSI